VPAYIFYDGIGMSEIQMHVQMFNKKVSHVTRQCWNVIVKQPFTPAWTTQGLAKQNCLHLFLQISFTGEINDVNSIWLYKSFEAYTVACCSYGTFRILSSCSILHDV